MKCPKCNHPTTAVMDCVQIPEHNETYRKKKCPKCKHIFYTAEFEVEHNQKFKDEWNKNYRK